MKPTAERRIDMKAYSRSKIFDGKHRTWGLYFISTKSVVMEVDPLTGKKGSQRHRDRFSFLCVSPSKRSRDSIEWK